MPEPRAARVIVREKQTGATALVHGAQLVSGFTRYVPKRGTTDLLKVYSQSPVLQAVIRKISSSMAAVQWMAKARQPDGQEVEIPDHIAERMINSGVPGLDGLQCRMLEQTFVELVGESYALIDRNRLGVPERRWPLPPSWVQNIPTPEMDIFDINPPGATPFIALRRDILFHKDADPWNPYGRGVGIARALADEIDADEGAAKHIASTLLNRARPDIMISGSKEVPLAQEDAIRLNEIWGQRFSGPENAGKFFVSASPITVSTLTPTFRELTLTDVREFERNIIINTFGIPPEILGVIENSNRATIESAEFLFMKHVIVPRLNARKAVYNEQLAPQYDDRLIIDYEDPVDENREFKLMVMGARPAAFSDDEYRLLANEEPLPDGEGERRPPAGPPPSPVPDGGDEAPGDAALLRGVATVRVTKIVAADLDEIVAAFNRALMGEVLRSSARTTIAEFASDALDDLGIDIAFDLSSENVEMFLSTSAGERSNLINGTTEKNLRKTLAEGVAAGDGQVELIRRVQEAVQDAGAVRADMIARTETTRAAGFANEEALRQADITEKQWLAVQDDRTRDTHAEMDGQTQPVGGVFQSPSGDMAMYPGEFSTPGENINCRCVVVQADFPTDKAARVAGWQAKAAQMDRLEATFSRQLRAVFRQQSREVVEAIERKGNQ